MKKSLSELIFADCLFIIFLSLSGLFDGALKSVFYLLAYVFPVTVLLFLWKKGEKEYYKISVTGSKRAFLTTLPFIFPCVLLILFTAFLTSLAMGAIGISGEPSSFEGNVIYLIVVSAFAPALFEEMLFRYLPLMALGKESPRLAVIYSAVLFALSHCNLFQIPYALLAGLLFAVIDMATESILPSIIIHFINNVLSIVWQRNSEKLEFAVIFLSAVLLFAAVSVFVIYTKREKLKPMFLPILQDKSKLIFTYSFGLYIIATIFAAVSAFVI